MALKHPARPDAVDDLAELLAANRISRREFVKMGTTFGLSLATIKPILAEVDKLTSRRRTPALSSKSVVAGVVNSPAAVDPAIWHGFTSNWVANHVFQGLNRVKFGTNTLEPCLAESWEQPNALTWIYHLRKGVRFHNGDLFTAADVVYTLNRTKKVSWGTYALSNVESISALDPYTVQVKLRVPDFRFQWFFYWPPGQIVSKNYFEKVGQSAADAFPIGTNAFKFVSSTTTRVVLERNPDYWEAGLPKLDRVEFVLLDPSTLLAALKSREIELSTDVAFNLLQTATSFGDEVMARVGPHSVQTYLNMTQKPLNDVLVRQAMAEAMDNAMALAEYPTKYYLPSRGPIIHPSFEYSAYSKLNKVYTSNIDKAKQLLSRSSVPHGFTLSPWMIDAQRPQEIAAALGMQSRLSEIGIKVELEVLPDPSIAAETYTRPRPWQAITSNWLLNMPTAIDILDALGNSANVATTNFSGYVNPAYDHLLNTAITTTSEAERSNAFFRLQQLLIQDVPFLAHGWDGVVRTSVPGLVTPPQTLLAEWDDWFRVSYFT